MKQEQQPNQAVLRIIEICVGILCLALSVAAALPPLFVVSSWILHRKAFDWLVLVLLGVFIAISAVCGALAWKFFVPKRHFIAGAPLDALTRYNKHDDPYWCMGVFGLVGGSVLVALNVPAVIDLVRNHTAPLFAIAVFVLGVMAFTFWRVRLRFLKALQICQERRVSLDVTMREVAQALKVGRSKLDKDVKADEPQPVEGAEGDGGNRA